MRTLTGFRYLFLGAALAEVVLLRVAIRVGPFFPADATADMLFGAMQIIGLAALNTMLILGVGLLAWECVEGTRSGQISRAMSAALAVAAVAAGLALPSGSALLASALLFFAALLTSLPFVSQPLLALSPQPHRRGLRAWTPWSPGVAGPLLPLLSYASLSAYYGLQSAAVLGLVALDPVGLFWLGEALAVAAAIALPWAYRPSWQPRMALLAAGAGAAFLALGWGRSWLLGTMLMWNWGFSLWLPLPLYAVALATFLYTVLALLASRPSAPLVPMGLLLVGLGGLKLDYTPYMLLALIGFLGLGAPQERSSNRVGSRRSLSAFWVRAAADPPGVPAAGSLYSKRQIPTPWSSRAAVGHAGTHGGSWHSTHFK